MEEAITGDYALVKVRAITMVLHSSSVRSHMMVLHSSSAWQLVLTFSHICFDPSIRHGELIHEETYNSEELLKTLTLCVPLLLRCVARGTYCCR